MEPEKRLVARLDMGNGLSAHFYDQSREAVADRWQVQLLIRIPVAVKEAHFQGFDNPAAAYEAFTVEAGRTIYFEVVKVRNFIESKQVRKTIEELKEEFVRSNLSYLSRQDFAARLVLKRYREWQQQQQSRPLSG